MPDTVKRLGAVAFVMLFCLAAARPAAADSACAHRGDLDARYCDDDRDLVADLPLDSDAWARPDTLGFSYVATGDPAQHKAMFRRFMAHLATVTGRTVHYVPRAGYAAQVQAMRRGRLHVTAFATGATPYAVNLGGFVPFGVLADADGDYGYRMQVIVPAASEATRLADLAGRTVAHTEESSNSGNQAPRALLPEHGLAPGDDYTVTYSGGHEASIKGVVAGHYAAAAVASSVLDEMVARGTIDRDAVRVLYESRPFPSAAFGHAHDLHPRLARLVRRAFFTFDFDSEAFKEAFDDARDPRPLTYRHAWAPVRAMQAENDVRYSVDALVPP